MRQRQTLLSAEALLSWYDQHRRVMPWRVKSGQTPNSYHVWLSEIMLQQTTVMTVSPYFKKFIQRWPTIEDLAKASENDILTEWAGLGYYSRARNLHKCALKIINEFGGQFPQDIATLKSFPGVGEYTANAIRAIAFDQPATVVDGNVERVVSRLFAVETPLVKAKKEIKLRAEELSSKNRPADYAQAIMDLGATICTPRNPKCLLCPWQNGCRAFHLKNQEKYPIKLPKKKRPKKQTTAFIIINDQGKIFLRRRPDKGLLAGMMEVPSTNWQENKSEKPPGFLKKGTQYQKLPGKLKHVFTHFELIVDVVVVEGKNTKDIEGVWVNKDQMDRLALPTLMKKIIAHADHSLSDFLVSSG